MDCCFILNLNGLSFSMEVLTVRKVLDHLEEYFRSTPDRLAEYKHEVKDIIEDFRNSHALQRQPKTFQFSKTEDDIILRAIAQYKETFGVSDTDLCPLHNIGLRKRRPLWKEISDLLPHRTPQLIYMRAMRLLREKNGKWSKEQIGEIKRLVDQNHSYSEVGKLLGMHREDVRGVYMRSQERKVSGQFSKEEDDRLVQAIKQVTGVSDDLSLPLKGISWKDVASEMNNERQGSDYCKRWRLIKPGRTASALGISETDSRADNSVFERQKSILNYLEESGAEDSTEITWAEMDRVYDWPAGIARRTWTTLYKKLPLGTHFVNAIEMLREQLCTESSESADEKTVEGTENVAKRTREDSPPPQEQLPKKKIPRSGNQEKNTEQHVVLL